MHCISVQGITVIMPINNIISFFRHGLKYDKVNLLNYFIEILTTLTTCINYLNMHMFKFDIKFFIKLYLEENKKESIMLFVLEMFKNIKNKMTILYQLIE